MVFRDLLMLQKVEYMLYFVEASCTYRNSLIGENYVTSEEQSIILITSFILGDAVFQYMLQHQCPIQKCIALQGTTFHERILFVCLSLLKHVTQSTHFLLLHIVLAQIFWLESEMLLVHFRNKHEPRKRRERK